MESPFAITVSSDAVQLQNGRGKLTVTVTNNSNFALKGRAEVVPGKPEAGAWLSVARTPERQLAPGAVEQFIIEVNVPKGSPQGDHSFRLRVVDVADPNERVTIGPAVGFKVAETPQPTPPFRWWIPVVIGVVVLLLVGGGIGFWLVSRDGGDDGPVAEGEVPDVTAKTLAEAQSTLKSAGFVLGEVKRKVEAKPPDIVLEQTPAPRAAAAKGATVTLVATHESLVLLPRLDGKSEDQARSLLAGLLDIDKVERNCVKSRAPVNSIYESNPRGGDAVARTTKLLLRVKDDCVELPKLIGMEKSAALVRLNGLGLLGTPVAGSIDPRRGDSVESQSPNEGELLAKGSAVTLRIFDQGPTAPVPTPVPVPAPPVALSGLWSGNDGGTYAIRQVGNEVWWYGQDRTGGRGWTNVFHGRINGRQVTGNWADVPVGNASGSGLMTVEVIGSHKLRSSSRTGGFGGSEWDRLATGSGRVLNARPITEWRPSSPNVVSGIWRANDGGTYAIRQIGSEVWWYGQDGTGGKSWTNVFQGRIIGQHIIGYWADVPIGRVSSSGAMTLKIGSNRLEAASKTGGFGGSIWTKWR